MAGLSKNMQAALNSPPDASAKLRSLHVLDLKLNNQSWTLLADGVKHTRALETLKLNMVNVDRANLQKLADAMKTNASISVLDLSFNDMADANGDVLARIISN